MKSPRTAIFILSSFITLAACLAQSSAAEPLRYQPKAGSKFAYEVEIVAELPGLVETSQGTISYEVKSADDIVTLDYSGGLKTKHEHKKSDIDRLGRPPFHHSMMFGSSINVATQTKNRLTLTSLGKLQSIEGNSQLPYLLGHLSIFVFEPLAEKDQKSWTSKKEVGVYENNFGGWCRRPPRFWANGFPDKTTAANESTSFVLKGDKDKLLTFKKTYRLSTVDSKKSFTITGDGQWTFNRELNVPESSECKYNLSCKVDTITLDVPITVKYRRLSDGEFAKLEKEKEEKGKQRKADHEKRLADRKAPITDEDRKKILTELKSSSTHELIQTLWRLKEKTPREDKIIAQAIKKHLKSPDNMVRNAAEDAIAKFDPVLGQKIKLNKAYSEMSPLDVTGNAVTAQTPLPPGLIVAVKDMGPWYFSGKIIRKLEKGQVEVQLTRSPSRTRTVHFSSIRLAPPEVDQPFVGKRALASVKSGNVNSEDVFQSDDDNPAQANASDRSYRTWTDNTGTFAIVAKYVESEGDKVLLKRKEDGRTIKVPLSRLSEADRKTAKRLQESPQLENPFEP